MVSFFVRGMPEWRNYVFDRLSQGQLCHLQIFLDPKLVLTAAIDGNSNVSGIWQSIRRLKRRPYPMHVGTVVHSCTHEIRVTGSTSVRRRRIYLPMDELVEAVLIEEDIFRGKVTDKWRRIMKGQIQRAMLFFDEAEKGGPHLDCKQMAVSSISVAVQADLGRLKRQILDAIEANDYNNFTKRAYVGKAKKLLSLPVAYARAAVA